MKLNIVRSCALGLAMAGMSLVAFAQQSPSKQVPPDQQPQSQAPTQPQSQTETPGAQDQTAGTPTSTEAMQSLQGTISQSQDGYVLKDPSGVSYQLDDQKKAKEFDGQNVKVTGTVDSSTHMIHVSSISPAS